MTTPFNYVAEHERKLHDPDPQSGSQVKPYGCELCWPNGAPTPPTPPPTPEESYTPPRQPISPRIDNDFVSLGDAIERIKARRGGVLFGDGLPPEPEPPESPNDDPWCERCHGARILAVRDEYRPTTTVPCPDCQSAAWAIDRRRKRLGMTIPPRFANCRIETFPDRHPTQHAILEMAIEWLEDPQPSWLFLWGPTGRGKTGLAVSLLYELAARQSTAFQITTDLLTTIKSTFGSADGESESSILDFLYSVDVFCLDDLGSEHHRGPEDWAAEKVFQLIGGRHAALKRTIVTSNYSLDELQGKLGHARTIRRIVEATTKRWIIDFRGLPSLT